jgi:hypothetical protein
MPTIARLSLRDLVRPRIRESIVAGASDDCRFESCLISDDANQVDARSRDSGALSRFESERVIGLEEGLLRDNLKHLQTGLAAEPFWIPTACGVPRGAEVRRS